MSSLVISQHEPIGLITERALFLYEWFYRTIQLFKVATAGHKRKKIISLYREFSF